jgi:hypothetical protein
MKGKILIYSFILFGLPFILTLSCNKPIDNSFEGPNKYLFRDTTSPVALGSDYYPALQIDGNLGYYVQDTFSYDLWIKPTRTINMLEESDSCFSSGTSTLYNSNQNWVLIPNFIVLDTWGPGLSVGTNGLMVVERSTSGLFPRLCFSVSIKDWVHVAIVFRPDSLLLYLNGNLIRSNLSSCSADGRSATGIITGILYSPDFLGDLDEFRIWDIALTSSEVKTIMDKKLTEQVNGLRYYISFDNGTFDRTLGDQGGKTMIAGIKPKNYIKTSSWNFARYKGKTISNLTPY